MPIFIVFGFNQTETIDSDSKLKSESIVSVADVPSTQPLMMSQAVLWRNYFDLNILWLNIKKYLYSLSHLWRYSFQKFNTN